MVATAEKLETRRHFLARPDDFARAVLHMEPDPWQAEALRALSSHGKVAIRSGHGPGKTTTAAIAVIWGVRILGAIVPCTAPTEHQLDDLLWPEIDRWLARAPDLGLVKTAEKIVDPANPGAFAVRRVARRTKIDDPTQGIGLAGFHGQALLYVVDEAAGVLDETMAVIEGALTTPGSGALLIGNPTRPSGYFIDCFGRNSDQWITFTISSEDSPRVSRRWVANMAATWGRDSNVFRIRVLGLPPQGEAKGFIPFDYVARARATTLPPEGRLEVGVDIARYGEDASAIYARRGPAPVYMEKRRGLSIPAVTAWAAQVVRDLAVPGEMPMVRPDDGGVGGGVTDLLGVMVAEGTLEASVSGMNFGGAGDRWYATNAGVWWSRVRTLMQKGQLSLPDDEELASQLTNRTSDVNLNGKIVLEPKEHMKARGVPSPDLADALVLAYAGGVGADWVEFMEQEVARRNGAVPQAEPTEEDVVMGWAERVVSQGSGVVEETYDGQLTIRRGE